MLEKFHGDKRRAVSKEDFLLILIKISSKDEIEKIKIIFFVHLKCQKF